MSGSIRKTWNFINSLLIAAVVLLAVLLVGVRVVGLEPYVVLSGSMEPAYKTGSVLYVKEAETGALEAGDVITFRMGGGVVATHRIVEVTQEDGEKAFRTKGDANEAEDASLVPESSVLGTPIFSIPGLGYFSAYIQSAQGRYVAIAAAVTLIFMIFLPDVLFGSSDKDKKDKKE